MRRSIDRTLYGPVREAVHLRIHDRTPRGKSEPHHQQRNHRGPNSGHRHILDRNSTHSGHDRVRGRSHWHVKGVAAGHGRWQHEVEWMGPDHDGLKRMLFCVQNR